MEIEGVTADGIRWRKEGYEWTPLCPKHYIRLTLTYNGGSGCLLECAEDKERFGLPREFNHEKEYIQNKVDAAELKKLKYVDLDGEFIVIAKDQDKSDDGRYFVDARLTESKVGLQLVVYAGEKGKEKTQIFVQPDAKKLSFDHTNTHPADVFVKLEATFDDGSTASIKNKTSS